MSELPVDVNLADMLGGRLVKSDGRSAVIAARLDQRCSYCLYSPTNVRGSRKLQNLLVYIHGEGRRFQFLINALRPLARSCQYLLLCPLFPANILRDGNIGGYKYLREGEIRYDEVLIDVVSELREAFSFEESRFLLGGFSGGGQFAHRFCYLYPHMLKAVSIGAPGSVTLLNNDVEWWAGTGAISSVFGREVDLEGLRKLSIQLIVGDTDTRDDETVFKPSSHYWLPDANVAGKNRVERLNSLHRSFEDHGINARLDIVPGVGHSIIGLLPKITEFLSQGIREEREGVS